MPGSRANRIRAEPLSCQSCRSKKLRCNRVQPCSNCTARHITCHFLVPPQRPLPGSAASRHNDSAEIIERIERLENLTASGYVSENARLPWDSATNAENLEATAHAAGNLHQNRDEDLHLLEDIGARDDSLLQSLVSKDLSFQISSIHEILDSQSRLRDSFVVHAVRFPDYRTAVALFESYEYTVGDVCRVLHIPTVQSLIKTFYLRLGRNETVASSQAALLLSIYALGAFFYRPSDGSEVVTTGRDAVLLSRQLAKGALDALDHSQRNTSGALEDVQACVIMSYVTYHLDGLSARPRHFSAMAAAISRDLRLHRLDADLGNRTGGETNLRDLIDRELKRRVMWHIAATDWLKSSVSGTQEGMYFIHPNHLSVDLPKDCDDDEIVLGQHNQPTNGPQPTNMTFFLARIRLAELCREMTDSIPLETSKLMQLPYEYIVSLDKKLVDFMTSLPVFFRLDTESRETSRALETVYPKIPIMRYCIMRAAHSRRCKLHQKFLLRQSSDPRYVYSRQACLESARAIIQLHDDPRPADDKGSNGAARMGLTIHFTHLALVVMVMDLCFNKDVEDGEDRKDEVKRTLEMLEKDKDASPLLDRCLESLQAMLRKHGVRLTGPARSMAREAVGIPFEAAIGGPSPFDGVPMRHTTLEMGAHDNRVDTEPSFDELWQIATQGELNLEAQTWDSLFSALDSQPF